MLQLLFERVLLTQSPTDLQPNMSNRINELRVRTSATSVKSHRAAVIHVDNARETILLGNF